MTISEYIENINARYKTGISTEHSYRGDLQNLLESLATDVMVTNEPARVACGAPDYIITRKNVPVGYIEAKDIGKPLDSKEYKEQFDRYRTSLSNLIITDYLEFRLFHDGNFVSSISIGEVTDNKIYVKSENLDPFRNLLKEFYTHVGQTIKSSSQLAKMMAGKARLLADVVEKALCLDENDNLLNEAQNIDIYTQYQAFKTYLIHDIKPKEFADVYAQTIAYGMFAARLNDPSLVDFSRQEAAELIPKSNPFLRNLFQQIAGYNFDNRIKWIVDALADIFRATSVAELLKDFGKATQQHDPMIHFYETFLAEYDPKLRKSRGVYYTPEPVVNFIVRAVDDILKAEFNLPQGLADTSRIKIKVQGQGKTIEKEVHKVQILDPAAGTGTFLAEVIKHVYKNFEGQQGVWSNYVEEHLIPRLNGFEILMAPYTMAHVKLDLLLKETGYVPKKEQRLRVYLTNTLEEHHPDTGTLFSGWLSNEANEANHVKKDTPVMVVLGNPPYSGHSANKGKWIEDLIKDYFQEPSGGKLKEQNAKWLNDDYVKFIRYAQLLIDKNQEGILAFITNNGYLDNPTFRGMRYNLMQSFDIIYSIDLHGSSKKQEKTEEGTNDINVFDIQQGVAVIIAAKLKNRKKSKCLKTFDLFGTREFKYEYLINNSISNYKLKQFLPYGPNFIFKLTDEILFKNYNKEINVIELFPSNVMGFQTHRDGFAIGWTKEEILKRAEDLRNTDLSNGEIIIKYNLKDNRDWKLSFAREIILNDKNWGRKIDRCNYRPFDNRFCYFSSVMMDYPRKELVQHVFNRDNLVLGIGRQGIAVGDIEWSLISVSKYPVDANVFRRGGINLCPLYLYRDEDILDKKTRIPNLNHEIVRRISEYLGLKFNNEKEATTKSFAPIDILDYLYAILHSPEYRNKYREFLKIDFPRIPYPKDRKIFWALVKLGGELRQIHLLESPVVEKFITTYPVNGSNEVGKVRYENKRVWINDLQYFDKVPQVAWDFFIGGYQPAQKWLKDRKGRTLSFEDIMHYQKIIVALSETDRIMKKIDQIDFLE